MKRHKITFTDFCRIGYFYNKCATSNECLVIDAFYGIRRGNGLGRSAFMECRAANSSYGTGYSDKFKRSDRMYDHRYFS